MQRNQDDRFSDRDALTPHVRPGCRWALCFFFSAWLGCAALILHPDSSAADERTGAEYRVKTGFIYHFARFTQWPEDVFPHGDAPIYLCLASDRPEAEILFSLHDKRLRNRRIDVRKFSDLPENAVCQILYIASGNPDFAVPLLEQARKKRILTIGETPNFTRMGGVIRFFMKDDRLQFAVNVNAARRAHLKLSSQLLMSAEINQEGPQE